MAKKLPMEQEGSTRSELEGLVHLRDEMLGERVHWWSEKKAQVLVQGVLLLCFDV